MDNNELLTIPFLAGESFRKHGENKAMGFVGEDVITYNQLEAKITVSDEAAGRLFG
jgi:hypothetical protein